MDGYTIVYPSTGEILVVMSAKRFVACGMYAFNNDLRHAWQALFDGFFAALPDLGPLRRELLFETGERVLADPALLFGHTCGYPLVTRLRDRVSPFCVPVFDVPGTDGVNYSSHFIVPADSDLMTLSDCRGLIAAINTTDSNSGMNLLRHAVADLARGAPFFARVDVTGGHLHSLEAVATNRAQVAAIDCVSFELIAQQDPALVARVRSLGFSAQTCGLPFVLPGAEPDQSLAAACVEALRQALDNLAEDERRRLNLAGFEAVTLDAYDGVIELERQAREKDYAELK